MNIGYLLSMLLLLAGISGSVQTTGGFGNEATGLPADTPFLQISSGLAYEPVDYYDTGNYYKTAKEDYRRINEISRWTSVVTRSPERSLEGGEAKFYFTGTRLEKIIVRDYGEMYQQLTEYYLRNGQLSFVVEEKANYNMPFYLDSTAAAAAGETEFFDIQKSEVIETRYYFEDGALANLVSPQDCGAPWAAGFIKDEEKRLKGELKSLQLLLKSRE